MELETGEQCVVSKVSVVDEKVIVSAGGKDYTVGYTHDCVAEGHVWGKWSKPYVVERQEFADNVSNGSDTGYDLFDRWNNSFTYLPVFIKRYYYQCRCCIYCGVYVQQLVANLNDAPVFPVGEGS